MAVGLLMMVVVVMHLHYSRWRISFCAFFCHRPCPCEVLSSFFEKLLYIDIGAATDDNDDDETVMILLLLTSISLAMVLSAAV